MKELQIIQTKLKAPKSQYNEFGKYNYRSCEDIVESVKPILAENECTLTISDEIVMIGTRIYVKATATITNSSGDKEHCSAFAREEESKKGMDSAQLTGSTSSYARKYALNGLFCIDDTKDPDFQNDTKDPDSKKAVEKKQVNTDNRKVVPIEKMMEDAFLQALHNLDKKNRDAGVTKSVHSILEQKYILTTDEIKKVCNALGEYEKRTNQVILP